MSFKFVRQKDSMQCGVAALSMVCRHFGIEYSLRFLDSLCHATTEGVSMKGMADAAKSLGLETSTVKIGAGSLLKSPLPAILHWNQNHFVVLWKISKDGARFYLADPAKGKICYSCAEFLQHWASGDDRKGIAMFFEPSDKFGTVRELVGGEKRSFRFLAEYMRRHRRHLAVVVFTLLSGCAMQLVMPFLTQSIVDRGINDKNIGFIWLVLLGELMIVAGRTLANFVRSRLLLRISMNINIDLVSDFIRKLLRLPMSFFDIKLIGDLLQRMNDHSRVQSFLTGQVLSIAFAVLSFMIFGAVLLIYDPLLFGVFIAGSVAYGAWTAIFLKRRKAIDYELFECQALSQNRTYRLITSMQEVKLQDCGIRHRKEWEDAQTDFYNVQMKSLRLQQSQEAGAIFINEVKNILITVLAATAVIKGGMSLGAMLAVQYIVGQLSSPVEQMMQFVYSIQDVKISLERINEIHDGVDEDSGREETNVANNANKSISFDKVCFKYDSHALVNTLEDISFDIPEGKVTAIVGASGSGKTTLIKLILGYYQINAGVLKIAGNDMDRLNLEWWRRQCGVVMQDGVIFSESIERNIAVSDGEIDRNRVEEAAMVANIKEYINSLPLKYDTKIGSDGVGLSQGQKQRILIARAVYKNPPFILLDEATNALDAKNERVIVENLARFYKGRTVVVVAHRLSTVRDADKIIVLDGGRVAETGSHESLIRKQGAYYTLVKNQLELGT